MASEIKLYDVNGTLIDTINGTNVGGTVDIDGKFHYTPAGGSAVMVDLVLGNMGSAGTDDVLTVDMTPQSGTGALTTNGIRATASAAGVNSFISLAPIPGTSTPRLSVHTPRTEGTWMLWEFGVSVPAIKLKVKIVRV